MKLKQHMWLPLDVEEIDITGWLHDRQRAACTQSIVGTHAGKESQIQSWSGATSNA